MNRTCRVGVHGRNNPVFEDVDYQVIQDAGIEAIKMMSQTQPAVFERIKSLQPNVELITRLYEDRIGSGHHPTPADYAAKMIPILKNLQPYCQKFHITNEPNHIHRYEGWGATDEDAQNFNEWFLEVYDRLKQACPWAELGFPGLAVPDFLHRDRVWLKICRPAVERADWLGVHCYWQTPNDGRPSVIFNENFGLTFKYYHQEFPDKVLEILECGNSNIQSNIPISEDDVAREYTDWLQEVFKYPYINSASFFILSSQDTGNWAFFSWREESGRLKPVVHRVKELPRPRLMPVTVQPPTPPAPAPVDVPEPVSEPEPVTPGGFTNQNMIDAMYNVGRALGIQPEPWGLLTRAGLSLGELAADREAVYDGLSLAQLNLTPEERRLAREELAKLGPGGVADDTEVEFTNQNVIDAFHQAGRKLGLADPWALLVKAGFTLGELAIDRLAIYSGRLISQNPHITEEEKSLVKEEMRTILGLEADAEFSFGSPLETAPPFLRSHPELVGIPPAMPKPEHLPVSEAASTIERRVCQIWNRYGWVLMTIADLLVIEVPLAVAIPVSEGQTRGVDSDGRMIIRFEVHLFREKLGPDKVDQFDNHFQCDSNLPWQSHQWRDSATDEWQNVHQNQDSEWAAFDVARSLDDQAAKLALAMGMPGILGCNHAAIGYNSVDDMYNAFASSERCQLIGLFDLIGGPGSASRTGEALADDDIDTFAALYKGSQEAAKYSAKLRQAVAAFEKFKPDLA